MSLQNLMERQFGASKLYWGVAVSGQLALLLVVLWFSLIGAGPRTSLWLGTIVFLLPVVTFLSKRKATRHYRQGESLRRAYLFLQTMGKKPGNALTICAHADSPVFAFSSPEVVGEYYATVLPEGHKKLVEAVLESAFYTRSIANFASIACGVVPPTIDTALYFGHDSSMRTSSRRAGAEVENCFTVFQGAFCAPSSARARLFSTGCESAQSIRGLACADQGHPRAALDANDLRIRRLGAQHPVESYRQPARRRHLGHAFRLADGSDANTACETLHPTAYRVCAASTSNMRRSGCPAC
jgi:hypothetical protein